MLNVWIREFFTERLGTQKLSKDLVARVQGGIYTLFQPEVVGGLIDGVEVWCWLTTVNADGHDRQRSHDLNS